MTSVYKSIEELVEAVDRNIKSRLEAYYGHPIKGSDKISITPAVKHLIREAYADALYGAKLDFELKKVPEDYEGYDEDLANFIFGADKDAN